VLKAGTWYLVARHRSSVRTYRVARIRSLHVLDVGFERPADFDLASHWDASMGDFERLLLRYSCRLRLSGPAQRLLGHLVDPGAAQAALDGAGPPDERGWRVLDLHTESEEVAAGQLVGLGEGVEVVAPVALRRRLAEIGRGIAERNAGTARRRSVEI
jgi:predicted DNA-binding transcriptional regulator YafY